MSAVAGEKRGFRQYLTPAVLGISALALTGLGVYWYSSEIKTPKQLVSQGASSASESIRGQQVSAKGSFRTAPPKEAAKQGTKQQPPATIERLPLNTSVSHLIEMLSKSATQSQRLSQLALLAAQSAHKPLLQAHAASGALSAVLPLLRPGSANTPAVQAAAWHALTNAASHPDMYTSIGVGDTNSPGMLLQYATEGLAVPAQTSAALQAHSRALAVLQNLAQREEGLAIMLTIPAVLHAVGQALQAAAEQADLPAAERKKVALGALKVLTNSTCDERGATVSAEQAASPFVRWMCAAVSDAGEVGGDSSTAQVCPDTAERCIHVLGNWAAHDAAWDSAAVAVAGAPSSVSSALLALQRQVPGEEALQRKAGVVLQRLDCEEAPLA